MRERRAMASRPYYRKSHEADRLTAIVTIAWLTGILCGVTIVLGWYSITGGA